MAVSNAYNVPFQNSSQKKFWTSAHISPHYRQILIKRFNLILFYNLILIITSCRCKYNFTEYSLNLGKIRDAPEIPFIPISPQILPGFIFKVEPML